MPASSWEKLTDRACPKSDMGRIALAVSPQKPDVLYAHVQTATGRITSGILPIEDAGKRLAKRGATTCTGPAIYGEIFADPVPFDRVYIMDMMVQVTEDGGKTSSARVVHSRRSITHWPSTRPTPTTSSRQRRRLVRVPRSRQIVAALRHISGDAVLSRRGG